jgi:hypothetical protein
MEVLPIGVGGPTWANGRARVENGEIILDKNRYEEYEFNSPEDSEQMAFDLAALSLHPDDERKVLDEREVLSFVGRYGLLWHGAHDLKSGECRESLEDWWREVGRLYLVGLFHNALMKSKRDGSVKPIQTLLRRSAAPGFPFLSPSSKNFHHNYVRFASIILQDMINDGLNAGPNEIPPSSTGKRRCWWGLQAVGPGEFQLVQFPPDLLSRAYAAFSVLIAGNVETRFCQVCGKQFRPKTRRSEACEDHVSTNRSQRHRAKLRQMDAE